MADEEPLERTIRHGIEQRTQFDILAQVSDLGKRLDSLTSVVGKQGETLEQVKGWLVGSASPNGIPTVGLLVAVAELNASKKWFLALAQTAVGGILLNALMTFLHYAGIWK